MANKNDLFDFDETIASNNDNVQGANIAENCAPSGINNAIRGLASIVKRAVGSQGSAIASAATTAIGAPGTALYTKITGTTTITGFGAVAAGTLRILEFEGALTLTHNATSLILPGGANITTAPGDTAILVSESSGNWRCVHYQPGPGFSAVDLLSTQTASASPTLDFVLTNYIGSYRSFQFRLLGISPATDAANLWLRTSTNAGTTYDAAASDYAWNFINIRDDATSATFSDTADPQISCANAVGNLASEGVSGTVDLYVPTSIAARPRFKWSLIYQTDTPILIRQDGIGRRAAAADIDAVRFLFSTGNIASGAIQLFGIR